MQYNKNTVTTKLFSLEGAAIVGRMQTRAAEKELTAKYRGVDTHELVDSICHHMPILNRNDVRISTRGSRASSTNHVVRIPSHQSLFIGESLVTPELILRNSFAGESTLIMNLGFFRQVCSNGMMVGESLIPSVTLKHINGPKFETGLNNFFYDTQALLESDIKELIENGLTKHVVTAQVAIAVITTLPVSVAVKKTAIGWLQYGGIRELDKTGDGFSAWNIWNIVNEAARQRARDPNGVSLVERESKLMDSVVGAFKNAA